MPVPEYSNLPVPIRGSGPGRSRGRTFRGVRGSAGFCHDVDDSCDKLTSNKSFQSFCNKCLPTCRSCCIQELQPPRSRTASATSTASRRPPRSPQLPRGRLPFRGFGSSGASSPGGPLLVLAAHWRLWVDVIAAASPLTGATGRLTFREQHAAHATFMRSLQRGSVCRSSMTSLGESSTASGPCSGYRLSKRSCNRLSRSRTSRPRSSELPACLRAATPRAPATAPPAVGLAATTYCSKPCARPATATPHLRHRIWRHHAQRRESAARVSNLRLHPRAIGRRRRIRQLGTGPGLRRKPRR